MAGAGRRAAPCRHQGSQREAEIAALFGRPLSRHNHDFTYEGQSYAVYCFARPEDAELFMKAFDGEPFDPLDIGRGSKWMVWYKGRNAKRRAKRNPYDFGKD